MVRLRPWLGAATQSGLACFRGFAAGLRRDQVSIDAAIREPWSDGQNEGQVNKLKMLKRQMYGRARVPLLRQRMLAASAGASDRERRRRRRRERHRREPGTATPSMPTGDGALVHRHRE